MGAYGPPFKKGVVMRSLFLIVNTMCDLNCRNCFYTTGYEKRTSAKITREKIPNFTRAIIANNFSCVLLTGGDPLASMYKEEAFALIDALKQLGVKVIVNTSAVKLDMSDIEKIIELKVDRLDISINSFKRDIHNYERGLFDDTIWSIKTLLANGFTHVSTTTVVSEYNAEYVAQTLEWLLGIGVESVHYQPLFRYGITQNYEVIKRALDACAKVSAKDYTVNYLAQCEVAYAGGRQIEGSFCHMGERNFVCDASGYLTPCFHRPDVVFGNILTEQPIEIDRQIEVWKTVGTGEMPCFGRHCASLFDGASAWKEEF